jgi:ArsR family transcriptional regulator, arsenate/arsenite/antimonite-responsive transcriptional repressor
MTGPPAAERAPHEVLRLLGDPMRQRIVTLLAAEQLCVCHLQEELDAKQTLVSHHLRALRAAGLVEAEPAGRFTYYRLVPEALESAAGHLADLAAQARPDAQARRACP